MKREQARITMIKLNKAQIFLSNRCTLACSYCFFKKSKNKPQKLRFDQIRDFLTWFVNYPGDYKQIELIGGEPLLEFDLVKASVDLLRHDPLFSGHKIRIDDITTNGTILTKEIIRFLKKEKMNLNFSLDGNFASNLNRKFKNGENSFPLVWKNIFRYKKEVGEPTIFMTICPNNAKHFFSNMRFLFDNGLRKICFNTELLSVRWTRPKIDGFLKEFRKFLKYYVLLKKPKNISVPFMDKFDKSSKTSTSFCPDHLGDQAVLHFDGKIYGCPLAPCFDDHYREFLIFGENCRKIDCRKLLPMRKFDFLKEFGLKSNGTHPFLHELSRMLCLCFSREGKLIPVENMKNNIYLLLQIYQETKKIA